MSMFAGTVGYYRRYRPGIPGTVAEILDQAVAPGHPRRLLDVGTGTGLVVEALLGRFDDIIAIDNDADMLAAAQAALRPALPNGATLVLTEATAEDYTPRAGWQADLVTICPCCACRSGLTNNTGHTCRSTPTRSSPSGSPLASSSAMARSTTSGLSRRSHTACPWNTPGHPALFR